MVQPNREALKIIDTLKKNGFQAFLVGGCVRDMLLEREPKDWDITTSATPEQVEKLFAKTIPTGIKHGTITVAIAEALFEVTTFRQDGAYSDHRRPNEVTFSADIKDDLSRRDFTMNAIAYSPYEGFVDPFGGANDIRNGVIKSVGNADARFCEDPLRMMRAIRFKAQLGFEIASDTFEAISKNSGLLKFISAERIRDELVKTLLAAPEAILDLFETSLMRFIVPEALAMVGFDQNNPHHSMNLLSHTASVMKNSPRNTVSQMAAFLHDIAKPSSATVVGGVFRFFGHAEAGAKMADEIMARLKFDNATRTAVVNLVLHHDRQISNRTLKNMLAKFGSDFVQKLIDMKKSDALAQNFATEKLAQIAIIEEMLEQALQQPCSLKELAVNGHDLKALGMNGTTIGETLNKLLEMVQDKPEMNERNTLMELVRSFGW